MVYFNFMSSVFRLLVLSFLYVFYSCLTQAQLVNNFVADMVNLLRERNITYYFNHFPLLWKIVSKTKQTCKSFFCLRFLSFAPLNTLKWPYYLMKRNSESKLTNEFITKWLFTGSSSLSLICNELFSQEAASVWPQEAASWAVTSMWYLHNRYVHAISQEESSAWAIRASRRPIHLT